MTKTQNDGVSFVVGNVVSSPADSDRSLVDDWLVLQEMSSNWGYTKPYDSDRFMTMGWPTIIENATRAFRAKKKFHKKAIFFPHRKTTTTSHTSRFNTAWRHLSDLKAYQVQAVLRGDAYQRQQPEELKAQITYQLR